MHDDGSKATFRASIVGELRSSLVELLLSLLWVFGSLASAVAAEWICIADCLEEHKNYELRVSMGAALASDDHSTTPSPMCPPATAPMQISMASGFLAAVACGLTTGLSRHGSSHRGHAGHGSSASDPPYHAVATADHHDHHHHHHAGDGEGGNSSIEINTRGGFHPTVALALALRGRLHMRRMLLYVIAQLVGACLAALLVEIIVGRPCAHKVLGDAHRHAMSNTAGALLLQALLNLLLALIYLWTDRRNHLMAFPIIIGFHYAASFLIGLQPLGLPVLNPTRAFGVAALALAAGNQYHSAMLPRTIWQDLTVGWAGALLGVALAVGVDFLLFAESLWGARENGAANERRPSLW